MSKTRGRPFHPKLGLLGTSSSFSPVVQHLVSASYVSFASGSSSQSKLRYGRQRADHSRQGRFPGQRVESRLSIVKSREVLVLPFHFATSNSSTSPAYLPQRESEIG